MNNYMELTGPSIRPNVATQKYHKTIQFERTLTLLAMNSRSAHICAQKRDEAANVYYKATRKYERELHRSGVSEATAATLQKKQEAYTAVREAEAAYTEACTARDQARAKLKELYAEALDWTPETYEENE